MRAEIILAIDPGPEKSAWLLWDAPASSISDCGHEDNAAVADKLRFMLKESHPVVAIELVSNYGLQAGREVFETCYWIGEYLRIAKDAAAIFYGHHYRDYSRYWCKIASASSSQLYGALRERFGAPGTRKAPGVLYPVKGNPHLRDALALAVYVADTAKDRR